MAGQDLGTDAGSVALNMGTKFFEAIMKLFEKLFQAWRDAPHRKLQKEQLSEAKDKSSKAKIIKKMDSKSTINLEKLKKYARAKGDMVVFTGITFTNKDDMKLFSEAAKRQNLTFSGVFNKKTEDYHISCLGGDVAKVKGIVQYVTDTKKIEAFTNRIEEIKSKGNLTEQDKVNIEALEKARKEIQDKYSYTVNEQTFEGIIDDIMNPEPDIGTTENYHGEEFHYDEFDGGAKESTLAEALDRYTNGELVRDCECVVVDAREPDRYVVAHGTTDNFNNQDYIRTTYKVHNPNGNEKEFSDKRFEGRPKGYWTETKNKMLEFGGFQKNAKLFRFSTVAEFTRWQELAKEQNTKENIHEVTKDDYASVVEAKRKELTDKGYDIGENGMVVRTKDFTVSEDGFDMLATGENAISIVAKAESMDIVLGATEAVVIGKEIENYETLIKNQEELSIAKADLMVADTDIAKSEAETKISSLESERSELLDAEWSLINERKGVNACQAEQERRSEEPIRSKEQEQSLDGAERAEHAADHENGERDRQGTMEEYEGEISEEREKANNSHGEEHSTDKTNEGKNGAEKGTEKATKKVSHDRAD